jgi:hypothetical protein
MGFHSDRSFLFMINPYYLISVNEFFFVILCLLFQESVRLL